MKKMYLMIKTHKETNKKYLCKRVAETDDQAIKYHGSGLKWKRHLNQFGKNLDTQILFICPKENKEDFAKVALHYSQKFDILNDPQWLNMIFEEGQGGSQPETNGTKGKKWIYKEDRRKVVAVEYINEYIKAGWQLGYPESFRKQISNALKGKTAHNKGKQTKPLEEYKSISSKRKYGIIKKTNGETNTTERRRATSLECLNRPEVKAKFTAPRKSLIIAKNIETNEVKTLGRNEWYTIHKVNYKRLLIGRISNGWKMVVPADPDTA